MQAGDNPRFVVTSLEAPSSQRLYEDLYGARGKCENNIKAVKNALHSDRTSATSFLANAMRLLLACAASVLHHALRTHTRHHAALAQAQPSTVILTLFKIALQIKQYKGSASPPPAQCLPCQSAFTLGNDPAMRRPCAWLQHVVSRTRPHTASRLGRRQGGPLLAVSTPPEGVKCVRLRASSLLAPGAELPRWLEARKNSLQAPCPWTKYVSEWVALWFMKYPG